jgi:hypothetical protein
MGVGAHALVLLAVLVVLFALSSLTAVQPQHHASLRTTHLFLAGTCCALDRKPKPAVCAAKLCHTNVSFTLYCAPVPQRQTPTGPTSPAPPSSACRRNMQQQRRRWQQWQPPPLQIPGSTSPTRATLNMALSTAAMMSSSGGRDI